MIEPMRLLRQLHLYLSCLFAPALVFFAVTGSWQLYRWSDSTKDRSYIAPPALVTMSAIHKNSHLPGKSVRDFTPLRTFSLLAAIGLVTTTVLGVVMAFRVSQSIVIPLLCLAAGVGVPAVILCLYR